MEKEIKIEQRGEIFVYSEITTFPTEYFSDVAKKRNIQIVELLFDNKSDLEYFLSNKREEKETIKAQLSYSLIRAEDELKQLDSLVVNSGIVKRIIKHKK